MRRGVAKGPFATFSDKHFTFDLLTKCFGSATATLVTPCDWAWHDVDEDSFLEPLDWLHVDGAHTTLPTVTVRPREFAPVVIEGDAEPEGLDFGSVLRGPAPGGGPAFEPDVAVLGGPDDRDARDCKRWLEEVAEECGCAGELGDLEDAVREGDRWIEGIADETDDDDRYMKCADLEYFSDEESFDEPEGDFDIQNRLPTYREFLTLDRMPPGCRPDGHFLVYDGGDDGDVRLGRTSIISGEYVKAECSWHTQSCDTLPKPRRCQLWMRVTAARTAEAESLLRCWLLFGFLKYGTGPYASRDSCEQCPHREAGVAWRRRLYDELVNR